MVWHTTTPSRGHPLPAIVLCLLFFSPVDRVCIRPEVSRTKTFGFSKGVSKGEFSTILRQIKLNDRAVDWSTIDLHYLLKVCSPTDRGFNTPFMSNVSFSSALVSVTCQ